VIVLMWVLVLVRVLVWVLVRVLVLVRVRVRVRAASESTGWVGSGSGMADMLGGLCVRVGSCRGVELFLSVLVPVVPCIGWCQKEQRTPHGTHKHGTTTSTHTIASSMDSVTNHTR